MKQLNKIILLILLCLFWIGKANSQVGLPDNSFGINGIKKFGHAKTFTFNAQTNMLSNGDYICVGGIAINGGFDTKILTKYHSTGEIDSTFGQNGIVYDGNDISFIVFDKLIKSVRQSDDKIVVCTQTENLDTIGIIEVAICRYLTNGMLDSTFGNNGRFSFNFGSWDFKPIQLDLQPDGKIIYTGEEEDKLRHFRLNTNGTPDSSFGVNGFQLTLPPIQFYPTAAALLNSGKFISAVSHFPTSIIYRFNSNGFIDSTFGINGKILIDSLKYISKTLKLTDGSIIMSGKHANDKLALFKLQPDGTIDSSFGANGIAKTPYDIYAGSIIEIGNGNLLLNNKATFGIYKFESNGKIDSSFGINGIKHLINYTLSASESMTIDTNDKVMIAGYALIPNSLTRSMFVARMDTNAVLDTSFHGIGYNMQEFGYGGDIFTSMALTTNQQILAISQSNNSSGSGSLQHFTMSKINSDGATDNSFGNNGFKRDTNNKAKYQSLLLLNNGHYLVAGSLSGSYVQLAKYNINGLLDSTFSNNGYSESYLSHYQYLPCAIDTDINSNIYRTLDRALNSFSIFRYKSSGTPDSSFGNVPSAKGLANFAPLEPRYNIRSCDLKVQSNNKAVVVGYTDTIGIIANKIRRVFLARFNTDGTPDSSFNGLGYTVLHIGMDSFICRKIQLQNDGKIVGVGSLQIGQSSYTLDKDLFIFRLNVDGTIDSTFGNNGYTVIDISGKFDAGNTIQIQSDGKITLTGDEKDTATQLNNQFVARLNTNGSLDISFGINGIFSYSVGQKGIETCLESALTIDNKLLVGGYFLEDTFQTNQLFISKILLGNITGILQFENHNSLNIMLYPNPIYTNANFEYELDKSKNISISIIDTKGSLVKQIMNNHPQQKGKHTLSFDLDSALNPGTYFIIFSDGNNKETIQFMKK